MCRQIPPEGHIARLAENCYAWFPGPAPEVTISRSEYEALQRIAECALKLLAAPPGGGRPYRKALKEAVEAWQAVRSPSEDG